MERLIAVGLTPEEVQKSKEKNGDNTLVKQKTKNFFAKFFENLSDPIIRVLIFAVGAQVILTLGRCNWFEIGGILLAILIATTVSTASEYGSELAFSKMRQQSEKSTVRVKRDGRTVTIPGSDIVVGDILFLGAGEEVAADGELIDGTLTVDQSALNGESADVRKCAGAGNPATWELSDRSKVFRGSLVSSGEGVIRVGRVGGQTLYGMIARDIQSETRESPLKLRLSRLARQISWIGYIMAAIVAFTYLFGVLVADFGFDGTRILAAVRDVPFVLSKLIHALTLMITVVVVAVPEGLPMMITVVLSANMKRMLRDRILVKKLVGIETAGSMNILFTDKTGTLTSGRITVDRIIGTTDTYRTVGSLRRNATLWTYLCENARYNSETMYSAGRVVGGNSTDRAIAAFFCKENVPARNVQEKILFTSERKYSAVTLSASSAYTLMKGAPDILLTRVRYALHGDRVIGADTGALLSEYHAAARTGARVVAVILSDPTRADDWIFLCLIVLKDPLRHGVREAVQTVHRAKIQVVMLTGDGKDTAEAIATECGIFTPGTSQLVLDGSRLREMSDEQLSQILPRLRVVSRMLPQDKTRLVRLAQNTGAVVGMTGDGINDAPSLKLADVGFAMGSGTDIAKSAGDIVILDNSLEAIGKTVLYGRTIFCSIRKFITFQLMMNLAACGVSLIGQFLGVENPITIAQMLWINIIMDTLGGLAFAGEAPVASYMNEKPKSREEPILSRRMLSQIVLCGGYTLILCVLFLKLPAFSGFFHSEAAFLTGFYALFVFCGIFNCFTARSGRLRILHGIGKNKPFLVIMTLIALIQCLMIYYGGALFRCVALLAPELMRCIGLAATTLLFDMVRRLFGCLSRPT